MTYKYETHLHTTEGSACASTKGADYIKAYYDAGYSGLFVTDHFFGGNTAVSREENWQTRVNQYASGYEHALQAAKKFNEENNLTGTHKEFKVFFGIEQTFNGDDYLIYGISPQWLLAHPEIESMSHQELFNAVNSVNGLMIQAHPFRLRGYIQAIHIHPREVHGIEIYNAGNAKEENDLAQFYAKTYDFPVTSGSDIHNVSKVTQGDAGLPLGGVYFDEPLKDELDYAQKIKARKQKLIC